MALALTWNSRADLDLKFDEFFNSNHTVSAWFMPQFPDSYIGPIIGEGSPLQAPDSGPARGGTSAFFVMGTGEWGGKAATTRMFLRIGMTQKHYDQPLEADVWHHVALVRDADTFTLFVNGNALEPIVSKTSAPKGLPVRLGHTAKWRDVSAGRPAQFYGLIDDVAVFTKALSGADIAKLAALRTKFTGNEPALLAGFPLSKPAPSAASKLNRKATLHGAAALVNVGKTRNSAADAKNLLMPVPAFQFTLPVSLHQILFVGQSPSFLGGSHSGQRNFIYDLSPIALKPGDTAKKETRPVVAGTPFHALTDGTVTSIIDRMPAEGPGTNALFVTIDGMPGYWWKHLHWQSGTAQVKVGDKVKAGDHLANIGDSGVGSGNIHLHTLIVFFPDGEAPPDDDTKHTVTVPIAFAGFFLLKRTKDAKGADKDSWNEVDVGMPQRFDVIANSPPFVLMKKPDKLQENKDQLRISEKAAGERIGKIRARLARQRTIKTFTD